MPDNKQLIKNLFSGIQDALFLGDPFVHGEFAVLMNPGQFLSPNLTQNAGSNDMAIQATIANQLFDTSYVYKELLGSVDSVFFDILHHNALPYKPLDPNTIAEMQSLEMWIATNQQSYEMYRDRYYDANDAYFQESLSQFPRPSVLQRLQQKKNDSWQNWVTFGHKQTHENKIGRYIYLTDEDPAGLWGRLQTQMQAQLQQSPDMGPYYQTFLHPAISSWNSSSTSWTRYEKTISESDAYQYSKQTSWSGGVSGGWGLWSWGGGTSGGTSYKHKTASNSQVHLAFDYMRVRVMRPWLLPDVFGYPFWTWKAAYGGQASILSDGGNLFSNPPVRPIGRMPVLPTYLIVARNLELSSTFSASEESWYHSEINANASIGYGPFSLSGTYSESTSTHYAHASFDGTTFRMDQPQIIAKTGILLPKSPNPNKNLPWQGDQWFPDELKSEDLETLAAIREADYRNQVEEDAENELKSELDSITENLFFQRQTDLKRKIDKTPGKKH